MLRSFAVSLWLLAPAACTSLHKPRAPTARDEETLALGAELFWRSLRWGDYDAASSLFQEAEPRLGFLERWTTAPPVQITDYQIVHIELTGGADASPGGLVVVKVERIDAGTASVGLDMIRQTWYREGEHWYLDPGSAPFGE